MKLLGVILLGWMLGCFLRGVAVEAQNGGLLYTIDSVSGLPVVLKTNASGALNAVGQ